MKIGIIGSGGIANAHAGAYAANNCEIIAVTDANAETAQQYAATHGGKVYTDYKELIDQAKPDIVSICTPPVAHEEAAVYALNAGVNVLCEKPMAYDIASAYRIREAVGKTSAKFMPAHRHRFLPANIKMKEIIASGKIGVPVLFNNIFCGPSFGMEGRWFTQKAIAGGGCILDTNSHSIDLFRFIVGEVAEQTAVMHRHFKTTDVEDAGMLVVKSIDGALGVMESAFFIGAGAAYIDIMCSNGKIRFDYFVPDKVVYTIMGEENSVEEIVTPSDGFKEQVTHLIGAIKGEHELSCTIEDGVRATEIICSNYK